jgi:hypothetical protein
MEFCPVCMLRKGLESGESSAADTLEPELREIQEIINRLEAEDPDFHASVKISAVPRKTYTGKTVTIPNIKQGWRIEEEHPFVKGLRGRARFARRTGRLRLLELRHGSRVAVRQA